MGNTFTGSAATPADTADGYYAKRAEMLRVAGTDNFNVIFNLDNDSTVANEAIVQGVIDTADRRVDAIAREVGVTFTGADGRAIPTTDARFGSISDWASRWARSDGALLRGETGNPEQGIEGQMSKMKAEAEKNIRAEFAAARLTELAGEDIGVTAPVVVMPPCNPCDPCYHAAIIC